MTPLFYSNIITLSSHCLQSVGSHELYKLGWLYYLVVVYFSGKNILQENKSYFFSFRCEQCSEGNKAEMILLFAQENIIQFPFPFNLYSDIFIIRLRQELTSIFFMKFQLFISNCDYIFIPEIVNELNIDLTYNNKILK